MTFDELLALVSSPSSASISGCRLPRVFRENPPRICADSRLVKAGDIFVAIKGTNYDGHDFIDQAIARDAEYIVCQRQASHESRVKSHETIVVDDSAKAAASLAQASRGNPASKLTNLAVTGTNGKTTVAYLVRTVIQKAGIK